MEEKTPCYTLDGNIYRTGQGSPVCDFDANGYRLPTIVEWEYAARGGLKGKRFSGGDTITHKQANYYSVSEFDYDISSTRGFHPTYDIGDAPYTSPGGRFVSNGYGLYDMEGNVWEWCWEEYQSNYRAIKGGAWNYYVSNARCGGMYMDSIDSTSTSTGFRAVCR